MTIWVPELDESIPTRYEQIAHAIERDIALGILKPGDKLPTQRSLAKQLNVTVATCGRGYALAASRGLTTLEVGRGSFVATAVDETGAADSSVDGLVVDLGINLPPKIDSRDIYSGTLQAISVNRRVANCFSAMPVETFRRNREAAATWLQPRIDSTHENVILCTGMQSALISGLSVVTQPGDAVLVEDHTFPGILTAARMLQLRLIPVEMDQRGVTVEGFEAMTRKARVVYLNPTNQNPTTSVLPMTRRKAIAKIIRENNLWLIEDDTYGRFYDQHSSPIARFVPDQCLYVASLSKTMSVGLRLAIMRPPDSIYQEVLDRFRATSFFPSPLSVEIATRWIEDGTANRLVNELMAIADRRQQIAREILGAQVIQGEPRLNHIWMSVSKPWTAESLVSAARENGVLLSAASTFSATSKSEAFVRIALGAARNEEELKASLTKIVRLMSRSNAKNTTRY